MTAAEQTDLNRLERWTEVIARGLREESPDRAVDLAVRLHPAELADVFEALPPEQRLQLWQLLSDPVVRGELLIEARREVRDRLIEEVAATDLAEAVAGLQLDELADLYDRLPRKVLQAVLSAMDTQRRERLHRVLSWPHDTAGGLMDADAVAVREDITLEMTQRYLRQVRQRDGALPEHTALLVVVDRDDRYRGVLTLADLASLDPATPVAEAMDRRIQAIEADLPAHRVARLFEDRDLFSAPVVDRDGRLIGRITVDDIVDVIREEGERSVMQSAGLDRNADMFAPVWRTAARRGIWLAVNLINAFLASWVIGRFGATIEQRVALAVLMPVVASMGGVAGIQTLTLVTRGIALDQVGRANMVRLLGHELAVGMITGIGLAAVLGGVAAAWFHESALATVFAAAVIVNMVNAAVSGTLVPLSLAALGIDPALAGGVALTALTDIVGFAAFLGLATWALV